jgi:hypothetical protein
MDKKYTSSMMLWWDFEIKFFDYLKCAAVNRFCTRGENEGAFRQLQPNFL